MKEEMTLYKRVEVTDSEIDSFVKGFCEIGIPRDIVEKVLANKDRDLLVAEVSMMMEDEHSTATDIIYFAMKTLGSDPITPHENFLIGFLTGHLIGKVKAISDQNIQNLLDIKL